MYQSDTPLFTIQKSLIALISLDPIISIRTMYIHKTFTVK